MITKRADETKLVTVDFSDVLDVLDQLTGTPTAEERYTADLTISSVELATISVTSRTAFWWWPGSWPQNLSRTMSLLVAGGTAGEEYTIRVTVATDSGQSLVKDVKLRVN